MQRGRGFGFVDFGFGQGIREPGQLLRCQKPLPLLLTIFLYMPAGIRADRPLAPSLCLLEYVGEEGKAAIGVGRGLGSARVKLSDVDGLNVP